MPAAPARPSDCPSACVVPFAGELDLLCRDACAQSLAEALAAPASLVVVDLREVTFLDAGFFGLLVVLTGALEAAGRRLEVIGAQPRLHRLLRLLGPPPAMVLGPPADQRPRSRAASIRSRAT